MSVKLLLLIVLCGDARFDSFTNNGKCTPVNVLGGDLGLHKFTLLNVLCGGAGLDKFTLLNVP